MTHRICILIPGFFDGGAQKQCIFLLNELARRPDIAVTLIYFHYGVHDDLLEREGIDIRRIKVSSNYDPRNVFKIRRVLQEIQPEILMTWLHACDVYGFFLRRTVPGMRWMMTERDSHYPADPRYILRRFLGRYADLIVANSTKGADYWLRARPRGRVCVVGNILNRLRTEPDLATDGPILSIGRLEEQKNVHTVIEAFAQLATRRPDLRFAVIGEGSKRAELESLAAQSQGADRIAFLGFRKDIPQLIGGARLVVSMSHHEGLPNVMLEAVASNRVVVASDIDEHRELLGPDYPFYVADRSDPAKVALAIEAALTNLSANHSLASAKARLATMTAESVTDNYLEIMGYKNAK